MSTLAWVVHLEGCVDRGLMTLDLRVNRLLKGRSYKAENALARIYFCKIGFWSFCGGAINCKCGWGQLASFEAIWRRWL